MKKILIFVLLIGFLFISYDILSGKYKDRQKPVNLELKMVS